MTDKLLLDKGRREEARQRMAELETRLLAYLQFKANLLSTIASLDEQLRQGAVTEKDHQARLAKLLGDSTAGQRLDYYDDIIRSCRQDIRRLDDQLHPLKVTPPVAIGGLLMVAFLMLTIPNWGALKSLVVYDKQIIEVDINAFVPEDAVMVFTAGESSANLSVGELPNVTLITSVYDHALMDGYYLENLSIDVTSLSFVNQTELTLTIVYNDSVVFIATAPIIPFIANETVPEAPPPQEEEPALLRINWTEYNLTLPNESGNISGNESGNITGNWTGNESIPMPNATLPPVFNVSIGKDRSTIDETVMIAITPENASYSIVVTDPNGTSVSVFDLNVTPWMLGSYQLNVLLYEGERSQRFDLFFTVGENLTVQEGASLTRPDASIQGPAEIGKPVSWKKRLFPLETGNITLTAELPIFASDITVWKITLDSTLNITEDVIVKEKRIKEENRSAGITGSVVYRPARPPTSPSWKEVFRVLWESFGGGGISGLAVLDAAKEKVLGLTIKDEYIPPAYYEVQYLTPPAVANESVTGKGRGVRVTAPMPYENVLAYVNLTNVTVRKQAIRLYRITSLGKEEVMPSFDDLDLDGRDDRMSWVIPRAENESYEVSLFVIDATTYLRDNENWTVRFNVTGSGNLSITPVNATFAEMLADSNATDDTLAFISLFCMRQEGNMTTSLDLRPELLLVDDANATRRYADLSFTDSLRVSSLRIGNYACDGTGSITTNVRKAGSAVLEFGFDGDIAYASDPVQTPGVQVSVARACRYAKKKFMTLAEDLLCDDDGMAIDIPDAELNCLGKTIKGSKRGHGVVVKAPRAKIKDCVIEGFDIGLLVDYNGTDDAPSLDGFMVKRNRIGIKMDRGKNARLAHGEVRDNAEVGLEAVNVINLTLTDIVSRNNPYGFRIIDSRPAHINVTAYNSTLYGAEYIDGGHAQRMATIP